jgi:leucine-rich repeat protein SHOC2
MDNLATIIDRLAFLDSISHSILPTNLNLQNKDLEYVWKQEDSIHLPILDNHLDNYSEKISDAHNLTKLCLAGNKLSSLPDWICKCYHLTGLALANNNLRELPRDFGLLFKLEYLDLSQNRFEEFPIGIENIGSLKFINLSHNNISVIPSLAKLFNLTAINLDGNPIVDFSPLSKISSLQYADFNGISLPRRYWRKLSDWKPEWILDEKNGELRQQLFDYFVDLLESKIPKSTAIDPLYDRVGREHPQSRCNRLTPKIGQSR